MSFFHQFHFCQRKCIISMESQQYISQLQREPERTQTNLKGSNPYKSLCNPHSVFITIAIEVKPILGKSPKSSKQS